MKHAIHLIGFIIIAFLISCGSDSPRFGTVQINFNNVIGTQESDFISPVGSQNFPFQNSFSQAYNVTMMKYIVTEIELTGANGARYEQAIEINLDNVVGAYVIDETKPLSQIIDLVDVPAGTYNQLSFTLGVEEEFVQQGATVLLDNMFWAWQAGYVAFKIEGQSPESRGDDFGDGNEQGFSYHIGGWQTPNNNRTITINLNEMVVTEGQSTIGLKVNGATFIDGAEPADFSDINSVHDPGTGAAYADNLLSIFSLEYVQ